MNVGIKFILNNGLFLRDPQDTDLGQRIIQNSIFLINEIGIEAFTFKKLATKIESTEASIYRYFDNKQYLLLFLTSWYWEWVKYLIDINTRNIIDPKQKLSIIIQNIVHATVENSMTSYVNENLLHKIIVREGSKAYHTIDVDDQNEHGLYGSYKSLVKKISIVIAEINPDFPYKVSLASNLFEMSNNQLYFSEHLPRLTDLIANDENHQELLAMMEFYTFKLLE